jgi:sarcosine oxidase subunit beta
MTNVDVVVVGAGILGASTAYFLRKSGVKKVLLIERGDPASGGTGKSAAIVRSYYSVPVMARLAQEAVSLFHNLEAEIGVDGGFHATGFTQLVPPDWVNTRICRPRTNHRRLCRCVSTRWR